MNVVEKKEKFESDQDGLLYEFPPSRSRVTLQVTPQYQSQEIRNQTTRIAFVTVKVPCNIRHSRHILRLLTLLFFLISILLARKWRICAALKWPC